MAHTCHAYNCSKTVPPAMLFCRTHWGKTPRAVQRAVWALYKPGQENRKDPSRGYLLIQAYAVCVVAVKEGLDPKWAVESIVWPKVEAHQHHPTERERNILLPFFPKLPDHVVTPH